MSLRRSLTLFVVALATLALSAGVSLVLLTTHLHRATMDMENSLQSVRVAEELQIDLLTYARSDDPVERAILERELRNKIQLARQYVNSDDEDHALNEAAGSLEIHFTDARTSAADPHDGNLKNTFAALKRF